MAGTFSQVYIHIIFSVRYRQPLLKKEWRQHVFGYIGGIITNKGHKAIIVNGVADHVHILIGMKTVMSVSDLVRDIKNNSSKFINEKGWMNQKFMWQEGYGAFSYAHSQVGRVCEYIKNQEAHHRRKTFEEEYREFMARFEVDYNERYLLDEYH